MTPRFGPISERELDIAEVTFIHAMATIVEVATDLSKPVSEIAETMLRGSDELRRRSLRLYLEHREAAS